MTKEEIQDNNIIIAKWLGMTNGVYGEHFWTYPYPDLMELKQLFIVETSQYNNPTPYTTNGLGTHELRFHSDSNWQWLCLKKISIEEGVSIEGAFSCLDIYINSKQDLFKAIFDYVKRRNTSTD